VAGVDGVDDRGVGVAAVKKATNHTAFIYDRGGRVRLFQIHNVLEVTYNRIRDDQSQATIKVAAEQRDRQLANLNDVEPGRHELYIFRGKSLAWCGPVTLVDSANEYDQWELTAADITKYLDRVSMEQAYDNSSTKTDYVVNRVQKIISTELAAQGVDADWDILGHTHFYVQAGDAKTTARTFKHQSTIFDHLDDLAAKSGIDYTVIGRELHVWDTSRAALGQFPTVGRNDFLAEPRRKKYGTELATRVIATDGQGGFGIAGGRDPYYGKWDIVVQAYDADTDTQKPTQTELNSQAVRSLKGRNPTPLMLSVPANTGVNPKSPLYDLDRLVPGAYVPLRLSNGEQNYLRMQKLQEVSVTDNSAGEVLQVSLYPAAGFGSDDQNADVVL
jgi:hypothetical protein